MDKVISARIDESVAHTIDLLARALRTSKKSIIERAVQSYAEQLSVAQRTDVFAQTSGAWQREETPQQTVRKARKAMNDAYRRHRR
jgi:predicted transcriptional regulator